MSEWLGRPDDGHQHIVNEAGALCGALGAWQPSAAPGRCLACLEVLDGHVSQHMRTYRLE